MHVSKSDIIEQIAKLAKGRYFDNNDQFEIGYVCGVEAVIKLIEENVPCNTDGVDITLTSSGNGSVEHERAIAAQRRWINDQYIPAIPEREAFTL